MKYLLLLAAAAALAALALVRRRPAGPGTAGPRPVSLLDLVRAAVARRPEGPLDDAGFPPIALGDSTGGLQFAPGAMDAILGAAAGADAAQAALSVLRAVRDGRIRSAPALEEALAGLEPISHVDALFGVLGPSDVTPAVTSLFWDLARTSRSYAAVKWGIAVGTLALPASRVDDLLLLARHGEFAIFAAVALVRESGRDPSLGRRLVDLLPGAYGWTVVRVADVVLRDEALRAEPAARRAVLLHAMANAEGLQLEIAFTIAKAVDPRSFHQEALDDPPLARALITQMDTLLDEPRPCGGLADLDDWPDQLRAYLDLLERLPTDAAVLSSLASVERFLADEQLLFADRAALAARTRELFAARYAPEVLRAGLGRQDLRWIALDLIRARAVRDLLPDVEALFLREPDFATIRILGELGEPRHLDVLLAAIPRLVDLEARRDRPRSLVNVHGPDHRHGFEYAQLTGYLGRLATPAAVAAIKRAADDYDPVVRAGACRAIAALPSALVDDEVRALVRERLRDEPPYVAEAADAAALHHGLPRTALVPPPGAVVQ